MEENIVTAQNPPTFPLKKVLIGLLSLIIIVLLIEGGYYFWIQREVKKQIRNPLIARQEGVFTYINSPDGTIQKTIFGTIKKRNGNLLTIKTDNNKTVQVLFTGENLLIADLTPGLEKNSKFRNGTIDDLLIGDEIRIPDIYSEDKGQVSAKSLVIVRGVK